MTSVASAATEVRNAAPSGVMPSDKSIPQTLASTPAAGRPLSLINARPWVRSTEVTDSPGACAAALSSPGSSAPAWPGGASSSHSPGPEPTTRVPSGSRAARPNGTPSQAATSPPTGARSCTLVSGVQSVRVSAPLARRPLTSHPALTATGGAGAMGLRATAVLARGDDPPEPPGLDTHPPPVRVDVRVVGGDPRLDQAPAGQPHRHHGSRVGEARLDLGQADGPAQRRRHPAGGDPPGDLGAVNDQAGFLRHHRRVDRLQPDQLDGDAARQLPG